VSAAILSGYHGDRSATEVLTEVIELGGGVWPAVSCRPVTFQITMMDPFPFANTLPGSFEQILALPHDQRAAKYRDSVWRAEARAEAARSPEWRGRWGKMTIEETRVHTDIVRGPSVADLAVSRKTDPFDLVIDLALADDLETRFSVVMCNDDPDEVASLLVDEHTLINLSDAGAHASQICDANFATYLLEHWVRELGVLTLPQAVHRLTGQPAAVYGLTDRGKIEVGAWADLVAFDAETVGPEPTERVFDLPANADRLISRSRGIEAVWVNGQPTRLDGCDLEKAWPGTLIRGGGAA
jgi:N-acyl-D-aspartate/D-glutamate deacylase